MATPIPPPATILTNLTRQCLNVTSHNLTSSACLQREGEGDGDAGPPGNQFIMAWWAQLLYILAFGMMILVAAGGNIVVTWIVLSHKRMRTVTNYFLVNLAIADTLIVLLNVLFNFAYMLYSDWPFGLPYCKFCMFIAQTTISASVFTLIAISIDRYIAIVHPMRPRMSGFTSWLIMACIWLTSCAISAPNIIYAEIYTFIYSDGSTRTVCYLEWPDGAYSKTDFIYSLFFMITTYFLPITVLAITYTRVGVELWGSQVIGENTERQIENLKSKRKVVKMMIIVVVIFAVCWLPQHVYFLLVKDYPQILDKKYIQHIYLVIYWLAMSNSMYNPVIYCWMNSRFRRGFQYVFRWCPFIHWEASRQGAYLLSAPQTSIPHASESLTTLGPNFTTAKNGGNHHFNRSSTAQLQHDGKVASRNGSAPTRGFSIQQDGVVVTPPPPYERCVTTTDDDDGGGVGGCHDDDVRFRSQHIPLTLHVTVPSDEEEEQENGPQNAV